MRILMVTEDIPAPQVGGLGKHVVTLSNALIAAGHQVTLMGRSDIAYQPNQAEIGYLGEFIPGFTFSGAGWKEKQLGVWLPFKRPALAQRISQAILRLAHKYDVVHYHGHLPMVGKMLAETVNFVQTRHDQGSECITHLRFRNGAVCTTTDSSQCAGCAHPSPNVLRRFVSAGAVDQYREATKWTFENCKTVFVSDFLRRQFQLAMPSTNMNRTTVIHNFIDLKRLNSIASQGEQQEHRSLLMVGRMDPEKGFGDFLEAVVRRNGSQLPIIIVGDGIERAMLQRTYENPTTIFTGWRRYEEVVKLTRFSLACVVPSVCQESCSTTTLEALALGRPCIALARGGTPELGQYQSHAKQLRLANNMDALADLAIEVSSEAFTQLPYQHDFGADIARTVPKLLDVYAA
jgi:glycogen(starch) synthase